MKYQESQRRLWSDVSEVAQQAILAEWKRAPEPLVCAKSVRYANYREASKAALEEQEVMSGFVHYWRLSCEQCLGYHLHPLTKEELDKRKQARVASSENHQVDAVPLSQVRYWRSRKGLPYHDE